MLTPYLPSPSYSGGQTRSFNLLKHLSKRCEITLLSFVLPDQDQRYVKRLKKYCKKIITINRGKTWNLKKILFTGLSPYPFLVANYFSLKLKRLIDNELKLKQYDLVHVECFYLMPNIPRTEIPVLLVDQTIEFAVYQHFVETLPKGFFLLKPLFWLDVLKLKFWETKFWKKASCLVAVSKEDQKLMEKLSIRKVEVVPNGVDNELSKVKQVKKYQAPTVLYGVANFKWMQNKEGAANLLRFVWPEIKKEIPRAKLFIAGRHSVSFTKSANLIKRSDEDIMVREVKNSEDVYRRSWVLVAPMKSGGGSRTKFFEAMACGLPIVTTLEGIEGIEAKNTQEVMIGNNFNDLARITVKLLRNKELRDKIGKNGRELVKEKYSWRESANELLKIYKQIS